MNILANFKNYRLIGSKVTGMIFSGVLMLGSLTSFASANDPVGYVSGKSGVGAELQRAGEVIPVMVGLPLFPGDHIAVIAQGTSIELRLSSHTGTVHLDAGEMMVITDGQKTTKKARVNKFVRSLSWAFNIKDRTETRNTAARNANTGDSIDYDPLRPVSILDGARFKMTHDFPNLMVRWCGDASGVEAWLEPSLPLAISSRDAEQGSETLLGVREESEFEGVDGPESIAILPVTAQDEALILNLDWINISDIPRPNWLSADWENMTTDEVFGWAQWLLDDVQFAKEKSNNLIALNMLAKLRDENWEAALALDLKTDCTRKL